jgi:enamine deaminase RidA (YjgF/YER057c/UK114 family)
MRKTIFSWLDREFILLTGEARASGSVEEQTTDVFRRFERELKELNLTLEHTVRTRIWGADKDARVTATTVRSNILTGKGKAASSSYISPGHFDSAAKVALDLLAMRPSHPAADRHPVEFEPPRLYISQLRYDSVLFVSGFTAEADGLEKQVSEVLVDLEDALKLASTGWEQVVGVSVYLSRTQSVDGLRNLLRRANRFDLAQMKIEFVDGFAREKALLEVEVTALISA